MDEIDDSRTPAAADAATESAVLQQLLDLHPIQLTAAELVREIGGETPGFAERDAIERAIRDLSGAGLLHRRDALRAPDPGGAALQRAAGPLSVSCRNSPRRGKIGPAHPVGDLLDHRRRGESNRDDDRGYDQRRLPWRHHPSLPGAIAVPAPLSALADSRCGDPLLHRSDLHARPPPLVHFPSPPDRPLCDFRADRSNTRKLSINQPRGSKRDRK